MPTRGTASPRLVVAALGFALLVVSCATSQESSPSEAPTTSIEASVAPSETETASPVVEDALSFVGQHLRGPRAPVLEALEELGYTCGSEQPNPPDLPVTWCWFAGGADNEGIAVIAAQDDFRGVGLITYDIDRMAEFLAALGSEAIGRDLVDSFEGLMTLAAAPDSLCPYPCESIETGPNLGNIEARLAVYEDGLLIGVLQEVGF